MLVEHIVDTHGEPALQELVGAYADGVETDEALTRIGLSFDTLQAQLRRRGGARVRRPASRAFVRRTGPNPMPGPKAVSRNSDGWRLSTPRATLRSTRTGWPFGPGVSSEMRSKSSSARRASRLKPPGIESPRGVMAGIAQELGDRDRAMRELEQLLEYDAHVN